MLRIIWILPGGCALLAVLVLALAFRTVDRSHAQLMPNAAQTRVALIELGEHPEWRQFLTLSAVHRANELNRLRELLDIQVANDVASGPPKVAPQLANLSDSDPEDSNVLNMQSRAADIGASTPVQGPIANENQAVGVQEEKAAIGTLLEDTPVAVQEEKPTVSALEETPVTIQEIQRSVLSKKIRSLFRKKTQRLVLSKKTRSLFRKKSNGQCSRRKTGKADKSYSG